MQTITAVQAPASAESDRASRRAAIVLGLALPADVLLYLLLPMYAPQFGITLVEAGILLAANRLVRIVGYGWVARFYMRRGDRPTCSLAAGAAAICGIGYATLSGFWLLLVLRLLWGLSFAALNLATQSLATAEAQGAARRAGRSRACIALGPMIALPVGALVAQYFGPRPIFLLLAAVALIGLALTHSLPFKHYPMPPAKGRRIQLPNSLDAWSFMEGLTLDGLFVIGLSYLGSTVLPEGAVIAAGLLLALRYLAEIFLSPLGGRMAEHFGAERLLLVLSFATALALIGFGAGTWLWACAAIIVILRALQLPLLPPIVARRNPGPERVQALAARSVWRDIGAGIGPMLAGVLLPVTPAIWIYGGAAILLALAAIACGIGARNA